MLIDTARRGMLARPARSLWRIFERVGSGADSVSHLPGHIGEDCSPEHHVVLFAVPAGPLHWGGSLRECLVFKHHSV